MQRWQIGNKTMQLCDRCTKDYSGLIISLNATWMGKVAEKNCHCDDCGCTDRVAKLYGKSRRVINPLFSIKNFFANIFSSSPRPQIGVLNRRRA